MKKSTSVVVATSSPINPLKTTLGLSVIHSMPGAQCRGPQTCPIPHPPTFACDPYNNTPMIATGRQTESYKTTTVHASNRSTFFHFSYIMLGVHTQEFKINALSNLDNESAWLIDDWMTKILPQRYREKMEDWFEKGTFPAMFTAFDTRYRGT